MTSLFRASSVPPRFLAAAGTAGVVTGTLLWKKGPNVSLLDGEPPPPEQHDTTTLSEFRIEVDLMDKIAAKPYLPPSKKRPRGVPRRIRVLALDVPEMRHQAFDGECRVHLHRVFGDGTAPPKAIIAHGGGDDDDDKHNRVEVMQKSLAKALVKCRSHSSKRIGVELLEASVGELNPLNLRRTHQFGNYRFDPGKYSSKRREPPSSETVAEENEKPEKKTNVNKNTDRELALATEEDELDAPWHQYAWIQELQLRIQGRVVFGESMEPASRASRLLNGSVYKSTVSSQRALYEWLLPPFLHRHPAGMDGETPHCWASQKPHAVIADGAALQRMPGSLRFLQKTCHESNVPLYIIHDPRVWGGNTHQDLQEALQDMRKTIKQNIVTQAMQGGSSFARGRLLGQMETEARWQARDMGRRTRQAVRDANEKLKRERENDWSKLDFSALEARLMDRRVIVKTPAKGESSEQSPSKAAVVDYTTGMVEVARQCIADEEARIANEAHPPADTVTEESRSVPTNQPISGVA